MCKCGKKYINPQHFKRHQKKCPQAEYGKTFCLRCIYYAGITTQCVMEYKRITDLIIYPFVLFIFLPFTVIFCKSNKSLGGLLQNLVFHYFELF